MSLAVVRVLGWLVIAHGVSHAVLPLRGSLAPAMLIDDWIPVGLYAVGMIGFVAAGLGMLGLRPLDRAISPLLVLSSGLSLVALVRFADPTLWFGAACDLVLFLAGLWRAYGGWPAHPTHGRRWHAAGLGRRVRAAALRRSDDRRLPDAPTWGSTRAELAMALPGDPPPRQPALELQHAVTIDRDTRRSLAVARATGAGSRRVLQLRLARANGRRRRAQRSGDSRGMAAASRPAISCRRRNAAISAACSAISRDGQ